LQALQFLEGAVIVALAGIDGSLVADEFGGTGGEGFAGRDDAVGAPIGKDLVADSIPNFDFAAAQAAKAPFVVDEGVDKGVFGGIGREMVLVVLGSEQVEAFSGFVAYDLDFIRVTAGLEGRCIGAWAGGFFGIGAVGGVFDGCHKCSRLKSSRGGGRNMRDNLSKVFGMSWLTIF
jgi:hypothetical protein